jgi:hypothetical protein
MVVNHEGDIVRQPRHKGTIRLQRPEGDKIVQRRYEDRSVLNRESKSARSRQQDSVDAGLRGREGRGVSMKRIASSIKTPCIPTCR